MKKIIFLLLMVVFSYQLNAQNVNPKFSISFLAGGNQNQFWGSEAFASKICREGCFADEQKGAVTFLYDIRATLQIAPRNTIGVGFSSHTIEYLEKGNSSIGGTELFPYEETVMDDYQSFYVTHGLAIVDNASFKVQLLNGVGLDKLQSARPPLKDNALFYRGALGLEYRLFSKVSLIAEGFLKTGLAPYSETIFDEQVLMKPYAIGGAAGIKIGLF